MYTITKEELGNRLKKVRLFLSITQTELKDNIGCSQVAISRMESGQGMAYELFIKTLCFYSQYIYIDSLFQEKFQIVSIDNIDGEKGILKSNVNTMAKGMIKDAISHYQKSISDLSKEISETFNNEMQRFNEELSEKIEKSSNLLSSD
jgi:transcriptional regulator with XRE-family HTH domain